jgi:cell division FtsZ-interacting protein ZapD
MRGRVSGGNLKYDMITYHSWAKYPKKEKQRKKEEKENKKD